MTGPLGGYRVLDLTRLLPGAHLTSMLAALGAEVIKVETVDGGDPMRQMEPRIGAHSSAEWMLTRGRKSVALDLKTPEGLDACLRLAAACDVVVDGFRPGVAERLGLGHADLTRVNPALVFVRLTGYGAYGEDSRAAGHDLNYVASTGLLHPGPEAGGTPAPLAVPVADLAGATTAAVGLLAALLRAARTGEGSCVEVAMRDVVMSWLSNSIGEYWARGQVRPVADGPLGGGLPCYRVYVCADGRWLAVAALEPKFWQAFCSVIDRPDLVGRGHDPHAVAEVERALRRHSLDDWCEAFRDVDACVTPVVDVAEALERETTTADGMVRRAPSHPAPELAVPIRLNGEFVHLPGRPSRLGEHTETVLEEIAGCTSEETAGLLSRGIAKASSRG
ncbi:CaiB/BaiF CoA transferase family protein [Streptomyces sp. NPDC055078]